MKGTRHPLRCPKPHNHKSRVHYPGSRPPVICVGGFHTTKGMESAIETDRCDAVSAARAFIADPYLFKNVQTPTPGRPVCGYCNGCIARFGGKPIDCFNDEIRSQKDLMLQRFGGV
jgi:2,4-dienoyl-CoA reductase-like NADH-dependent reductase (Old Yellow Enzyme family)